jgi:predicted HTH transcriptional regulator
MAAKNNTASFQKRHEQALKDVRQEAEALIKELQPAVDNYNDAKAYLDSQHGSKPKAKRTSKAKQVQRRSRKGGTHGERAVRFIEKNPEITTAELAKKLGLKRPAYAYRVLSTEVERGTIEKVGRGKYKVVS